MAAFALVLVEWGVELMLAGEEVVVATEAATAINTVDTAVIGGRLVAANAPRLAAAAGAKIAPAILKKMATHWTKLVGGNPRALELMNRLRGMGGRFMPARTESGAYVMEFLFKNKAGQMAKLAMPLSPATTSAQVMAWLKACLNAVEGNTSVLAKWIPYLR